MDLIRNYFSNDLDEAQIEAVLSPGRPQLVLSGAGSGKTFVLKERVLDKVKNKGKRKAYYM